MAEGQPRGEARIGLVDIGQGRNQGPFGTLRIQHHQIGIPAGTDRTLAILQSGATSWVAAQAPRQFQGGAIWVVLPELPREMGQRAQAPEAVGGRADIPVIPSVLILAEEGAVIRGQEIEGSGPGHGAKARPVSPQGRRTEPAMAVRAIQPGLVQPEILGTGLAGDIELAPDAQQRFGRGEGRNMDDMEGGFERPRPDPTGPRRPGVRPAQGGGIRGSWVWRDPGPRHPPPPSKRRPRNAPGSAPPGGPNA